MGKRGRVGLKDIAAETGVSSAAVSLVLNNRPGVSHETRRRVSDAAKQLGYEPRRSRVPAPTLQPPSTLRSVGFFAFGVNAALGHSYYGDILSGASAEARERGVQLTFEAFDDGTPEAAELPVHAADGLLISGRPPRDFVLRLQREKVPYILVCCSLAHLPGDTIGPENVESSYQAVSYLAGLGHRRIAYLGGEPDNADARERYLGYRWAVEDLGLEDDKKLALLSFFDTEHGMSGLHQLLEQAGSFTALYAASDFLAMGVYRSARELGISIPDQLSVFGFDNNALCETLHPTLSTMGLDRERVGRLAIRRLSSIVTTPQDATITRVPASLIERESCQALPKPVGS
ncbi:MAG: LacI family DNA-binding transcriptional regulator [Planctomycetota bacterium]